MRCRNLAQSRGMVLLPGPERRQDCRRGRPRACATMMLLACSVHAQQLPDGAGKEATKKICGNCHEIATVISARRTRVAWEHMVEDMITRGAEGSDEDMEAVVSYLTA